MLDLTVSQAVATSISQSARAHRRRRALLHEATAGAMRELDRLAGAALREAAKKKRRLVERDVVARIIDAEASDRAS